MYDIVCMCVTGHVYYVTIHEVITVNTCTYNALPQTYSLNLLT